LTYTFVFSLDDVVMLYCSSMLSLVYKSSIIMSRTISFSWLYR